MVPHKAGASDAQGVQQADHPVGVTSDRHIGSLAKV
jgi:hypothetical protein